MLRRIQLQINAQTVRLEGQRDAMTPEQVTERAAAIAGRQATVLKLAQELASSGPTPPEGEGPPPREGEGPPPREDEAPVTPKPPTPPEEQP